ncbi:hypothetical protein BO70DRAFT_429881 [Aspergillus heteromorphus CBS 117.55]|uniref:CENP-V/GFA domain-containing protein n=1 Tax=Aspergillus heteromorphus CBS 117.55 TaxID=1448321 RepID=A0A317W132_9EURO|nr:uncharacterized protein BO70DRAFT_429881 [Aspergillus heteromorphus CBS 117.55]PWY79685.1 hypothetical protein BO70DRAFT_429881 [Aspergillus heteromorphus CBS 117.55]
MTSYQGNCHCGKVRFEVRLPSPLGTTFACQCGVCAKIGSRWIFPADDQVKITRGEDELVGYGSRGGEHCFCPVCGTAVLVKNHQTPSGETGVGVNARALLDVNPFELTVADLPVPGKEIPMPSPSPIEPPSNPQAKTYSGSCHCGAITLTVTTPPFPHTPVKEDNCSICQRNANTCIYPTTPQVLITGTENATEYLFGRKFTGHRFCARCGVQVYMHLHGPPKALVVKLPAEKQEMIRRNLEIVPVRVNVLDGVEWGEVKVERSDEGTGVWMVIEYPNTHLNRQNDQNQKTPESRV